MALKQNGFRDQFGSLKFFGASQSAGLTGAYPAYSTGNTHQAGRMRNIFASEAGISNKSAYPDGARHPQAWLMPQKAGGMASRNAARIRFVASGDGDQGYDISGTTNISFAAAGTPEAVASGSGAASITFSASGTASAPLSATGSANITFSAQATPSAIADMEGNAAITFTSDATLTALGNMIAAPIDTSLTSDSIAQAVWAAIAAANNTAGTMGEKLNDAGSASNPWTEAIESGYTAAEILRILAAAMAGQVSGAGSGIETFKGLDGTTDRIISTVDEDGNRTLVVVDGA